MLSKKLLVVFLLILSSCSYNFWSKKSQEIKIEPFAGVMQQAIDTNSVEPCNSLKSDELKNICIYGKEFETFNKNNENCNNKNDENEKYQCLSKLKQDVSFCDKINIEPLKNDCIRDYYLYQAIKNNDSSFCNKIIDNDTQKKCINMYYSFKVKTVANIDSNSCVKTKNKDVCIFNYSLAKAKVLEEPNICDSLTKNNDKIKCNDNFWLDKSKELQEGKNCLKITDKERKNVCIFEVMKMSKDKTVCNLFIDQIYKNKCISEYNIISALEKNDVSFCEEITDVSGYNNCIRTFSDHSQDESLCSKLSKSTDQDLCLLNIKLSKNYTVDLCNSFEDISIQTECLMRVINDSTSLDKNTCAKINDFSLKNVCDIMITNRLSRDQKDVNLCNKLEGNYMNNCIINYYFNLAKEQEDVNECKKIKNTMKQNECILNFYSELASLNDDVNFCMIEEENIKNDCLLSFYLDLSIKNNDESFCNNLNDANLQNICHNHMKKNMDYK